MTIFLNGQFVPEERAVVSVFDRGFLFGDGLFETVRVCNGKPFRWSQHMERLQRGADFLKIKIPFTPDVIRDSAGQLIAKNQMPDALLRVTLSRGVGVRGYSPSGADKPTLVMSLHPLPTAASRCQVITATIRLPVGDPLANFKTANKLPQILARAEADAAAADEALLLNTDGHVAEATSGNVFWISGRTVCTPSLAAGILPGVTRAVVLEICRKENLPTQEAKISSAELQRTVGIFLSLTSRGIVEVNSLDGVEKKISPLTGKFHTAYESQLRAECA